MPPDEVTRSTLGLSAIAGGAVFGAYILATRLLAGQPVHRQDVILAFANVAAAVMVGALVAFFVGPVLIPMIPLEGLRDSHAVGFGIGATAWEFAPLFFKDGRTALGRWLAVRLGVRTGGDA